MNRKADKTGRSKGEARHVRLHHWVMETTAWRTMKAVPRAVLLEIMRRYNGSNNGFVPMSVRELSGLVSVGKTTAADALQDLEDRGFIREAIPSSFDRKTSETGGAGRSSRWRLTEFNCDLTGELATKEFASWQTPARAKREHRKIQNAVRLQVRSVPEGGQSVPEGGRIGAENALIVPEGGHSEPKTAIQRTCGRTVYSLPGGEHLPDTPKQRERSAPPQGAVASSRGNGNGESTSTSSSVVPLPGRDLFPALTKAFIEEPATLERFRKTPFSKQQRVAAALDAEGIDRARQIIMGSWQ